MTTPAITGPAPGGTIEPAPDATNDYSPAEVARAAVMFLSGSGIREIERTLGHGQRVIERFLDEAGIIDRRGAQRPARIPSVRTIETRVRRQRVAARYPAEASRVLAAAFGVSHRTILNDLIALGMDRRPAGGASPTCTLTVEERRARVLDLYREHTSDQIAELLDCSDHTVMRDVHELARAGLVEVRPARPRRKHPEPEPRLCDCGCGETFTPTGVQVANGYGRFVNREHYDAWTSARVAAVAAEAQPLYEHLTLRQIAEEHPHLSVHRVAYALRSAGVAMRQTGRLGMRQRGRYVKCKAREYDFCPHGEQSRWVYSSQATEFLSPRCWARYRLRERIDTMRGAWESVEGGEVRSKLLGKLEGTLAAKKAQAAGTIGKPKGYALADAERVIELRACHPAWGRGTLARAMQAEGRPVTEKQVRTILAAATTTWP